MRRRDFIRNASAAASVPFILGGVQGSAHSRPLLFQDMEESDRVLVLIRLNGGNDGLNTIIPLDQYSTLGNLRNNILIPSSKVIKLKDSLGLHPTMTGIKSLYDRGEVKVVQSVGYPNQNRSHFRSMEVWSTAAIDGETSTLKRNTGWLGRFLDTRHSNFPDAYPNNSNPDPFAISMGNYVSETCQGKTGNFSLALNDPFSLSPFSGGDDDTAYSGYFATELDFVRLMISQTNKYASRITKASDQGSNGVAYPETVLAQQLKLVARLISGGLRSNIFVVDLGGFDTHADQVAIGNPTTGNHATLLKTISDAVKSFQDDIRKQGLGKKVLGMTFSEFGRQLASNKSFGTDHGEAAPLIMFGSCVNPIVLGANPKIPSNPNTQAAVNMQFDFRDVYGSVLYHWFGVPLSSVRSVLYSNFSPLDILNDCELSPEEPQPQPQPEPEPEPEPKPEPGEGNIDLIIYPNPLKRRVRISVVTENEWCKIDIYDSQGRLKLAVANQQVTPGKQVFPVDTHGWPKGTYYVSVELGPGRHATSAMIKGLN